MPSPVLPETLCAEAVPVPSAKGKLPHVIHSLTQGPAQPRGTGFAEQAAIQYFVFSSLFNVWPQAKPCSEYRTGGFLPGFSRGSPRAAARQLTSTFVVKHPRFPNWKLMNREIRVAASRPFECLQTPKGLVFWATLHVQSTTPTGEPLWLRIISTSKAQIPGSVLGGKKSQYEEYTMCGFPITSQSKRYLLNAHRAADKGQEFSSVPLHSLLYSCAF